MRFRALVSNVPMFVEIVKSVSKLSTKCIMKLSKEKMHLVCPDRMEGGVQVWSQVRVEVLFSEYRIESLQHDVEIYLEASIVDLLVALASAASQGGQGREVIVKLGKRPIGDQGQLEPVLIWEIIGDKNRKRAPRIVHEHHIQVLNTWQIDELKEPLCPEPDVCILLPPLATVRTMTEWLSRLSFNLTVSACTGGVLKFCAGQDENLGVEAETAWSELKLATVDSSTTDSSQPQSGSRASQDPNRFFSTQVSVKSLRWLLHAQVIVGTTVICICEGHSLIVYTYIGEHEQDQQAAVLTFFIPAFNTDQDD